MATSSELHVDITTLRRNYCFLTILVVDTATQLLRELFLRSLDQPTNTFFQDERIRYIIRKLFEKKIINSIDRDNLLSPDVDVNNFDLSLLYTLLTTFCRNILRPPRGWTIDPDANDLSIGADLVRLRNFRNRVLAHRPDARINDEEYIQSWEEIKCVILRMARNELPDREQSFREQIDHIRTNLFVFYVYFDPLYMHSASASVRHLFAQLPTEKQKKQKTATTESKWILLEWIRKEPPASPSGVLGTSMCKILPQDRQQETTSDESSYDSLKLYLKNKDILNVWSKQESKYTDDSWQQEINLKRKMLIRYYGHVSCPSDAEGNPKKDSSNESASGQLIFNLEQQLEILEKWQEQETAYTEETREFILKSSLILDKPEVVSSVGPSSAEGSLLKGTSDDPSSGPLTLTLEKRLQILQKWQEQETAYTDETREFILKSGFIRDKPEKVLSVGPSSAKDDMEYIKSRRSPDYKPSYDSDKMEYIKSKRSPDDKPSDSVELTKLGTIHADKVIEEIVLRTEGRFCFYTSPVGILSIENAGVLRLYCPPFQMPPFALPLPTDLGIETSTHIYIVGCVSGDQIHQIEECLVLPSRDNDDGIIRFKSKLFSGGSFGSPCLVFKDGQFVLKGMLIGKEEGTDTPYELIAITFRCVWKRLGMP